MLEFDKVFQISDCSRACHVTNTLSDGFHDDSMLRGDAMPTEH